VNRTTRWHVLGVASLLALLGWFAAANFVPKEVRERSAWIPSSAIRLGLDLRGGIHWVLGPDFAAAIDRELDATQAALRERGGEAGYSVENSLVEDGVLRVTVASPEQVEALREDADDLGVLREVGVDGATLRFVLNDRWAQDVRERSMQQVLEVLRRRIDDPIQGVQESVVTRQGKERVLVQIPGGQLNRDQARDLIRKTGFLTFRVVIDQAPTEELLRQNYSEGLPEGTEILTEVEGESEAVVAAYLLPKVPDLTGDYLTDARSRLDNRFGWVVDFVFNSEGARRFAKLTEESRGRQLAIVLDNRVYSAPRIDERIGGGRGFIRGRFNPEDSSKLAIILRAGSLPIPVAIEEERTVGPALGADSIRHGIRASILGLTLVVLFAVVYYRLSGLYASLALFANLILLVGLMSMASATLTLPGIAGLVLTVGMAIDANVIIFERIREELRVGKTSRAAIRTGFSKALWTILDANITTLITAIVLFQYGTGPIKGFAVTLSIGIVTSVFAALVITRVLFEIYPGNRPAESLSI